MNIVSIIDGQALTTSLAIAEGVGNPHKSVIQLVRQNQDDLAEFGGVAFENAPFETAGGTQNREVALLNEQQATLLMTYMRNNDVVRAFKKRLVKEFYELAQDRLPKSFAEALRLAADREEEAEALRLENKAKEERIEHLENFFHAGMTITAFGKMLNGVNCAQMSNFCCDSLNWLYNESRSGKNKRWRVKSYARDRYLTETDRPIGAHGGETFIKHEARLLQKGAKKLYDLYLDGKLPMKKTWDGEYSHVKFHGEAA